MDDGSWLTGNKDRRDASRLLRFSEISGVVSRCQTAAQFFDPIDWSSAALEYAMVDKSSSRVVLSGIAMLLLSVNAAKANADELSADERAGIDAFNQGDVVGAMNFFERAADAGSPLAQTKLAWILDGANDDERAVELYRAAAERGFAPGMHGLGEMYAKGEGVEKDYAQAVSWFTNAAQAGHEKSLRLLMDAYESGELGLTPDPDKARTFRQQLQSLSDGPADGSEG